MKIVSLSSTALGLYLLISGSAIAQEANLNFYCIGKNSAIEVEVIQSKGKHFLVVDGQKERATLEAYPTFSFFVGKTNRLQVSTEKDAQGKFEGLVGIGDSEQPEEVNCEKLL